MIINGIGLEWTNLAYYYVVHKMLENIFLKTDPMQCYFVRVYFVMEVK